MYSQSSLGKSSSEKDTCWWERQEGSWAKCQPFCKQIYKVFFFFRYFQHLCRMLSLGPHVRLVIFVVSEAHLHAADSECINLRDNIEEGGLWNIPCISQPSPRSCAGSLTQRWIEQWRPRPCTTPSAPAAPLGACPPEMETDGTKRHN